MQRYSVVAKISGTGVVHHMMRAQSEDDAFQRLCRAYPDRKIDGFMADPRNVEISEEFENG